MHQLVLVRHGESMWNKENRFTGWEDIDLSEKGKQEAQSAGRLLLQHGFTFDLAYTSKLTRAIRTLWEIIDQMNLLYLPAFKSWRLNEKHYGALQGLNKDETVALHGEQQVKIWRRGYLERPEPMSYEDSRHPRFDVRYADLLPEELPSSESLHDTLLRLLPYWKESIFPQIKNKKRVLIVAHGNSLRALVKILDSVSDEEITEINIPNARPLVYELDDNMLPICHYYLDDKK